MSDQNPFPWYGFVMNQKYRAYHHRRSVYLLTNKTHNHRQTCDCRRSRTEDARYGQDDVIYEYLPRLHDRFVRLYHADMSRLIYRNNNYLQRCAIRSAI